MAHDVFISYSNLDKTVADAVCATLEARKIRCWIAPRDVPPGKSWPAAIVDAIDASQVFVLVLSNGSNTSEQVIREVGGAVGKGIPILPLRIEDVEPSREMSYYLQITHWLDALTPPLEQHLEKLANSVQALMSVGVEVQPPPVVETVMEAPAVKRRPLPTWAIPGLVIAGVAIVGGVGWLAMSQPRATPTPSDVPSTEVAVITEPIYTPVPEVPTTVPTDVPSILFRDDFNNELAEGWNILREVPTHWSLKDKPGSYRVTLQPGTVDGFIPELPTNVLLREAPSGDFEIATLVHFTPTSNYQFAGLFIYQDDQNVVQLGRSFCDRADACVGNGIYFDSIGEVMESIGKVTTNPSIAYLRLRREGTTYTGYYSEDGFYWTIIVQHTSKIQPRQVGLMAGQALEVVTIADFEYFTIETLPSPSRGWSEWRTLTFNIPSETLWHQSEDGSYTAIQQHDDNTFAWSEEIIEGDLIMTFDATSSYEDSEALVFIYGNGIGYAFGDLIFAVDATDNVYKIERDLGSSVYHEGENWLAIFDAEVDLDFKNSTYSITIEIIDDIASMYVDGVKVVSAFIPSETHRSGRIALAKWWESYEITYSNIRIKTYINGE
jgi:regulation of enolase protein 1 (concanavalin A-like superfamily)